MTSRPRCMFCGKAGQPEPEGTGDLWRSFGASDSDDSYSCRDAHECRWRMHSNLKNTDQIEV